MRSGQLILERRRIGTDPLMRLFGDVFQSEGGYVIEFKRKPAALEVITERARRLRFTRMPPR